MRMLVTRPEPGASAFAEMLKSKGVETLVTPLMTYEPAATQLPALEGVQAYVFTSSQGVRAYTSLGGKPDRPAFAVGEATTATLQEAGFTDIHQADGDVESLATLLRTQVTPEKGAVAHLSGAHLAGDLAGSLQGSGIALQRHKLYQATVAECLPQAAEQALRTRTVDAAAFFSPRTAATFATLTEQAGLSDHLEHYTAFCLSQAIANVFEERTRWAALYIAEEPTIARLLELIDHHCDNH